MKNEEKKKSKYETLYRSVKKDITEGILKPGEKLPSKRELARRTGLSVVTVEAAYDQLICEGYIRSKERSGYYVSKLSPMQTAVKEKKTQSPKREKKREILFDLTGGVNPGSFPFSVWARLMRETLNRPDALVPVDFAGAYELREAISEHLLKTRGMEADPENIIIGAGTEHLYNLTVQLFGRDKIFAVEDPGYSVIERIYAANGVETVYMDVDAEGADAAGVFADVIHVSPSNHFPTGTVMTAARRYELIKRISSGAYIIEDEYDSEFRLKGMPVETIWSMAGGEGVIYINTFSKSLSPTLRISYMILPSRLMRIYEKKLGFYSCAVPTFEQYTLAAFIKQGYFEKHINRVKASSRAVRSEMLYEISNSGIDCEVIENGAGQHFLLRLNTDKKDDYISGELLKRGVKLRFLSSYSHKNTEEHIAVISYSSLLKGSAEKAVSKIKEVLTGGICGI